MAELEKWKDDGHYHAAMGYSGHVTIPNEVWEKAEEAKVVLGKHQFQRSYEHQLIDHPSMPKEYYDNKVKELTEKYGKVFTENIIF